MNQPEITLRVPGGQEYALVLRLALGGVAILKDLDAGTLDDLRIASDEAVDCLLHQGRSVAWLTLHVQDGGDRLTIRIQAEFADQADQAANADELDISRAVLETLAPVVEMHMTDGGWLEGISLTMKKAAAVGA